MTKKNVFFFSRKSFLLNLFLWTRRKHIWKTLPNLFLPGSLNFLAQFPTRVKGQNIFKKDFPSKFSKGTFSYLSSYGHKKCCFDNPAVFISWQKAKFVYVNVHIGKKHTFFQKEASFLKKSKWTAGQVECSFDYATGKKRTNGLIDFAHRLKMMHKKWFRKNVFPKSAHMDR